MNNKLPYIDCRLIFILIVFIFFSNSIALAEKQFFYKWKDDKGTTHVTDNKDNVPQKFRNKVVKYEKKEGLEKQGIKTYYDKGQKLVLKYKYFLLGLLLIVSTLILLIKVFRKTKELNLKRKTISTEKIIKNSGIENMGADEFKDNVKEILIRSGYKLAQIDAPFKTFSDFIGEKKGKKYTVLISTALNEISKNQISDLESERDKYGCDGSIAIAKSGFDNSAASFAKENGCKIIDRKTIAKAILGKSQI